MCKCLCVQVLAVKTLRIIGILFDQRNGSCIYIFLLQWKLTVAQRKNLISALISESIFEFLHYIAIFRSALENRRRTDVTK